MRNRLYTDKDIVNQSTDDLDSQSSSISPLSQRQRARSKRNSIRSELKLTLLGSPQMVSIKEQQDLFKQKYDILNKIGEGGNAVVKKCRRKDDKNKKYVVKIMRFQELEQVLTQQSEYCVGHGLNHPNIIKFEEFIIEKSNQKTYIVQEYAKGDSLTKFKLKNPFISEIQAKIIMEQVFQGVKYLHKRDICHRDLHSGNIIYDQKTQSVKIIDFSISKQMKKEKIQLLTQTGVVYYMAPEQLDGSFYGKKVDSWALGVVLYVLLFGDYPFTHYEDNEDQVINAILQNEVVFPQNNFSKQLLELIKKLLDKNPKSRISIDQALNHDWFNTNKSEFLQEKLRLSCIKNVAIFKKSNSKQQTAKKGLSLFSKQKQLIDNNNNQISDSETNEDFNTDHSLLSQFQNPQIIQNVKFKSQNIEIQNENKNNNDLIDNLENMSECDQVNELGINYIQNNNSPKNIKNKTLYSNNNYDTPKIMKQESSSYNDCLMGNLGNSPYNLYTQSNSGAKIPQRQHYTHFTSFGSQNMI